MKVIVLAGGGGTRLFPLSRTCFPKQFMKIEGNHSLFAKTILRFMRMVKPQDILIVANHDYLHHIQAELAVCNAQAAHVILEPVGRNTAPAIALAARYCLEELEVTPEEILFVTPSDHIIEPDEAFIDNVRKAEVAAVKGRLVTFGIQPDKPETGYGYIQAGATLGDGFVVESFCEKPNRETAQEYLTRGNYYWNSGMFTCTISCFMEELEGNQPDIYKLATMKLPELKARFGEMPNISIDYAIAEKSKRGIIIPFTCYWNDIGSWDAIYDVLDKDAHGNALQGDCVTVDCTNTLLLGRSRLIAGIGLEDLLVVETDDVILVAQKGESQKVKELVNELKDHRRKEVSEHTTMYRPWGSYTVLGEGSGYKMKKIMVSPGQQLSLQLHYHRSEHWIVIAGTALVTIGETQSMVHENESVFVPQSTKHRLENPGKIPLEIIEVQNGSYLEEDDIVRFDDVYGRA